MAEAEQGEERKREAREGAVKALRRGRISTSSRNRNPRAEEEVAMARRGHGVRATHALSTGTSKRTARTCRAWRSNQHSRWRRDSNPFCTNSILRCRCSTRRSLRNSSSR